MSKQKNIQHAEQTIDIILGTKDKNGGEHKALEEVEGFISRILGDIKLGVERFDLAYRCFTKLLRYYPEHEQAKAYRASYAE
ncbi:hypothetical protein KY331_01810 [Candidatus Woesearchaeota archaeon]|nr:hypothetical protein [Candidatus Woesearchaeota archaeon]